MILQIWQSIPTIAQQIIIAVIAGLILWILLFPVRQFIVQRPEKKKEQDKKLRIHFDEINSEVMSHILEMVRNLTIRNSRLVFGSYAPVSKNYNFEKPISYECFELHFPEEAKEWKRLNEKALESNEKLVKFFQCHGASSQNVSNIYIENLQNTANDYIKDLQQEFKDYSQGLARKIESIDKYGMGKTFTKHKKCPVCKKF